ncbi:hypothetical protein [Flavobacterium sp. XGLA_31]|uniref:hypothetical protein n=1 Tax=Flavobacterium sp. XGLA_31 TaxID=3447666 RepID=UPI003F33791D
MPFSTVFEYSQSIHAPLVIEYFYKGEKIEDPAAFFETHPGLFETVFPSSEETLNAINKNLIYCETHKLVISEYGFHLIHR